MPNLAKYLGIGLLAATLAACDGNSDKKTSVPAAKPAAAAENATSPNVSLLSGKLTFTLPDGLSDQTGKLGNQKNNMHVYADPSGQKTIIVIVADDTPLDLPTFGQRIEEQQRGRDASVQVLSNKPVTLSGQQVQQFDSVTTNNGQKAFSSIVMAKVDNHLVTLQIGLPADNLPQAQSDAGKIIASLKLN
ncbi:MULTISPECIES: DcrB family lipoprotein [Dickeya]|uniref:DcrB innermembrane lipoprotein n=1 Tax=Dickeya aquatica TaxID=1401087 RepID=A0A375A577_9GAMM|nr:MULTISPECIES: DcrB family lipoprotein [Dickeya]SLM61238.1 DcrB innermembrane lipoprotein [Dickeya aquatica]